MRIYFGLIAALFIIGFSNSGQALDFLSRPDGHAPIGVMGDHTHDSGVKMVSYHLMLMQMSGLRQGVHKISASDELAGSSHMNAPRDMTMWMHMIHGMYGVTPHLTVAAMLPYLSQNMTMQPMMGSNEVMRAEGLGDVGLAALYLLHKDETQWLQFNLAISLPTGSTNKLSDGMKFGYPMQLGSGSYGLTPALVYKIFGDRWSYGTKLGVTWWLDKNADGYRRGNLYQWDLWLARLWAPWLSTSLRNNYSAVDPLHGRDPAIMTSMSPTDEPSAQNGQRDLIYVGANFLATKGVLQGQRLALEVGAPVYQDLAGVQMNTELVWQLGWQMDFH